MRKIGITGGIGVGKTHISKVFNSLGIPIFNSDYVAKKLMHEDYSLIKSIKKEFGNNIYINNKLDKHKLSEIIFSEQNNIIKLNNLVHPIIKKHFSSWLKCQKAHYVIKEAAILFESNTHVELDKVICVNANYKLRLKRLKLSRSLSELDIKNRMKMQMPQELKESLSDFIIYNNENDMLLPQILKIHNDLIS